MFTVVEVIYVYGIFFVVVIQVYIWVFRLYYLGSTGRLVAGPCQSSVSYLPVYITGIPDLYVREAGSVFSVA